MAQDKVKIKTNQPKKPIPIMDPSKLVECPLCLEVIVPPISYCEVGHSMCKKCLDQSGLLVCPMCKRRITQGRHVAFEQLLESVCDTLSTKCCYASKGCTYNIMSGSKESHERDCRYRTFRCEGAIFAGWKCNWVGEYGDLEKHFIAHHKDHVSMKYRTEAALKINFQSPHKDIQLISFFNGQAFFYYKHHVDVQKEKIYWAFQYVGLKSTAHHFFYEFEIHNGPVRKFKVSELCHNDTTRVEDLFELEKCVVMSFASARNFLDNQGELHFRFRIIKIKPDHH